MQKSRTTYNDKDKQFCPICSQKVPVDEYNAHLCKCYKFAKESTCIKLPKEDTFMRYISFKHMLERPYVVYADTECSLIPTNNANNVAQHVATSDCFYVRCTYDHTKNRMWSHVGEDRVYEMILELPALAAECIDKIKETNQM